MKPKGRYMNEKGAVLWWVLIILIVVIVGAVVAIKFLPGPSPSPDVGRMKVPPMPPSESPSAEPVEEESAVTEQEPTATSPQDQQEASDAPVAAQEPSPQTTESQQSPEATDADVEPSTASSDTAPASVPDAETTSEPTPAPENKGVQAETTDGEKQPQDEVMTAQDQPMEKGEPEPATVSEQTDSTGEPETTAAKSEEVVTQAVETKEEPPAAKTSEKKTKRYALQVGVFRNKAYAEKKAEAMKQIGYDAFLSPVVGANDETFYLVCFGDFEKKSDALAAALEFSEKEDMKAVVTSY